MTDESTTGDAESPAADTTEPIDPARPAETDVPDSAQPPTGGTSDRPDGAGVSIPSWLAGALVVILALLIGGAGFAIGRATAPDDGDGFRPIVATEDGRQGGGQRTLPIPGGPGGLPGMPGEGRGGDGQGGPRVFPGERDRGSDQDDDDRGSDQGNDDRGSDQGDDEPAPPQLPGT